MQVRQCPDRVTWWQKHVENKIRLLGIHEGTGRSRDDVRLENFQYECIYDILQDSRHPMEKAPLLHHLNAKISHIHSKRFHSLPLDTPAPTLFQGQHPSNFHLLNMRKRRASRLITSIIDTDGVIQTSTRGILRTFVALLQRKYDNTGG
jgi:hypothetical protein